MVFSVRAAGQSNAAAAALDWEARGSRGPLGESVRTLPQIPSGCAGGRGVKGNKELLRAATVNLRRELRFVQIRYSHRQLVHSE